MRRETRALYEKLRADDDDSFVHPIWSEVRPVFVDFVRSGVPDDFLQHQLVRHMLYRTGFEELEQLEVDYLEQLNEPLRSHLLGYREPEFGAPIRDSEPTNGSVTTLNKLYYFARIAEAVDLERVESIVDFGGGYGLMCHMFRELVSPPRTYVIVDLPEMLALQYAVLKNAGERDLVGHSDTPVRLKARAVNLVPVHLLADAALQTDVFMSTFALSETPTALQQLVVRSGFLGADAVYITGQNVEDEPWRQFELEEMGHVRAGAAARFDTVRIEPFPVVNAWELTAVNNRLRL